MKTFTKESLINELREIREMGWIPNARPGNQGGVGNTLEDLLEIEENNLPIPNAAEWELKTQRGNSSSLTTLFHMEPSPRAIKFVPKILLPYYGWPHKNAGKKYPATEMSFRQTIGNQGRSSRGFKVVIDETNRKVLISFDSNYVDPEHVEWLQNVEKAISIGELDPQPYWGFDDLFHKAGTKLTNVFYVQADRKKEGGIEYFHYNRISTLQGFQLDGFLNALREGNLLVDFDARTGHNHGTKFRLRQNARSTLYTNIKDY